MNLDKEYRRLGKILRDAYKAEIRRQDLIDTGFLVNTFNIIVDLKNESSWFTIDAADYFKYLDEPYSITKNVLNSREYKRFETELVKLYNKIITKELGLK